MALKQSDLKPRKKRPTPPKPAAVEVAEESHEKLAGVSQILAPENPHLIMVHMDDGSTREVKILKCKARQIGHVMRFLASAFKVMGISDISKAKELAGTLQDPNLLLLMISEIMDDAIATAALLTDLELDDFHNLDLDDAVAVTLAVWSVNQAFFLDRVLPMVQSILARGGLDKWISQEPTPENTSTSTSIASSG